MKTLRFLLRIVLIIVVAIFCLLAYLGFFSNLKITEKEMGPYTLVYESFTGPYKDTGAVFTKVYESLKADGIETVNGIGIYYDDPSKVASDKLKSDCGSVIEEKDLKKLETLKNKYKTKLIKKELSAVAVFPIKNTLSYMIGPMKAYPALAKYAQEKNYKCTMAYEFYAMKENKIFFIMPIEVLP